MKTSIFFIFLLCVFAFSATAQTVDSTLVISFENATHDYGTILLNGDGGCEFKFTNPGKTPLVLNNVQASCGCTVPEWTREPVQPGATGTIKVRYNTAIQGAFQKSITVYSNAKNNPVVLIIKGTVTPPPPPPPAPASAPAAQPVQK